MLHAFFLPGGEVQFGDFSQMVSCKASNSKAPAALPNTGGESQAVWFSQLALAAMLSLLGLVLRRRQRTGRAA